MRVRPTLYWTLVTMFLAGCGQAPVAEPWAGTSVPSPLTPSVGGTPAPGNPAGLARSGSASASPQPTTASAGSPAVADFRAELARVRTATGRYGTVGYRIRVFQASSPAIQASLQASWTPGKLTADVTQTNLSKGQGAQFVWNEGPDLNLSGGGAPWPMTVSLQDSQVAAYAPLLPLAALDTLLARLGSPDWQAVGEQASSVGDQAVDEIELTRGGIAYRIGFYDDLPMVAYYEQLAGTGLALQLVYDQFEVER